MLTAHSVAQVRAAEESLAMQIGAGSTGWDELMRRAALGLADALASIATGDLVVMLIGPGNNGGDALFAAAHLLDRGVRVDLCLLDATQVHGVGLATALAAGAQVVEEPTGQRTCIDALFGIGARPGLTGRAAQWSDWIDRTRPFTVAVDVPSGIDVDGGTCPGTAVHADATVTFGAFKPSLLTAPAAGLAGSDISMVDIGLTPHLVGRAVLEAVEPSDRRLLLDALGSTDGHKYTRGVVGVRAGSPTYAGAAHLCVAGAQAGPAGMVRFVGAGDLAARVVDRAPEVVAGGGRVQAWVVGPGGDDGVGDALADVLSDGVPVVVDATALEHVTGPMPVSVVLTPHAGELARMLRIERTEVEADPLGHAGAASERFNATVLLKGARTVIVCPDGRARVNLSGTPWLGTAGSGDVLAGFIGSLLATGLDPFDAASVGAFLHGAAAVAVGGPVTASDVARQLPATVTAFLAGTLTDVLRDDWA